jgi:hypothetical protein
MMRARRATMALLLLLACAVLGAQDASRVLAICDKQSLSLSEAAWLAFSSAGILPAEADSTAALARLRELGWIRRASRDDVDFFPATVGEFAFMAMKANKMRGGVGYALFPGPRYALREFAYLGLLPSTLDPAQLINGTMALRTLAKLEEFLGARK